MNTAYAICIEAETRRIYEQIAANGSLPQELARTKAFWYVVVVVVATSFVSHYTIACVAI